jgi:lipopolysaccharide biosynthesis regulator YciM
MEQESIRIMQYLDGDLEGKDLEQLLQELAKNESARKDLKLLQEINQFLGGRDHLAFRDALAQVRLEYRAHSRRQKLRRISWVSAAATVLILSALFIWQSNYSGKKTGEVLYAKYYKPYPAAQITRSAGSNERSLQDAFTAYEQKNYETAYNLFYLQAERNPDSITPSFYLGICALETNRMQKAVNLFREVSQIRQNPYRQHAQWFLALSFIKTGDSRRAVKQLEEIVTQDNMYSLLAEELLQSLN